MKDDGILRANKEYWDAYADNWFGMTALPTIGVHFPTEDDLNLFGDVKNQRMLEICCGSGHSLKYFSERGAGELWGVDMSRSQLNNADTYLAENHCAARLFCAPMEDDIGIPCDYFDTVYSIYGMGWATDLQLVFDKVAAYLKQGGAFIFSWKHPIDHCVVEENGKFVFAHSYFDESWFKMPVHDSEVTLCNRRLSTYINALACAGFLIERVVEEADDKTLRAGDDADKKTQKAKLLPLSFCIKARKL